jgi:hypothetical protein
MRLKQTAARPYTMCCTKLRTHGSLVRGSDQVIYRVEIRLYSQACVSAALLLTVMFASQIMGHGSARSMTSRECSRGEEWVS